MRSRQRVLPSSMNRRDLYRTLTTFVAPRPIAWVGTVSSSGARNLAPHSYYSVVSSDPPIVQITSDRSQRVSDTLANIASTDEFTVSSVEASSLDGMNVSATAMPPDEDEFVWSAVLPEESCKVAAPMVAAAAASFECEVYDFREIGDGTMVLGRILCIHLRAGDAVGRGSGYATRHAPIGRLGGGLYSRTTEPFHLRRLDWSALEGGPVQRLT